ncbi:MAG TPA: hypothetical protein VG943_01830 [Caulobacterales bacterium]|nr:hypothetical protein [Caulobacterales bacterium]
MWAKQALLSLLVGAALGAPLAADAWGQGRHRDRGDWGQPASVEPNWNQPPRGDYRDRDERQQEARIISVREAADRVRGAVGGGEMIGASLEGRVYVLRWRFPNQSVEDIRVDAVSGQVYR